MSIMCINNKQKSPQSIPPNTGLMQISISSTRAHSNGADGSGEVRQTQQAKIKRWQDGRALSMQAGKSFVIP